MWMWRSFPPVKLDFNQAQDSLCTLPLPARCAFSHMPTCFKFTLYCEKRFPGNWWRDDIRELSNICRELSGGAYSIEIVHLREERRRAFLDGVVTAPSVLLEGKDGRKMNLGSLEDTRRYFVRMKSGEMAPISGCPPVPAGERTAERYSYAAAADRIAPIPCAA